MPRQVRGFLLPWSLDVTGFRVSWSGDIAEVSEAFGQGDAKEKVHQKIKDFINAIDKKDAA